MFFQLFLGFMHSFKWITQRNDQINTMKNNLFLKLPERFISDFSVADGEHEVGDGRELVQVKVEAAGQVGDLLVKRVRARMIQRLHRVNPGDNIKQ